jgi:hypothetical protein
MFKPDIFSIQHICNIRSVYSTFNVGLYHIYTRLHSNYFIAQLLLNSAQSALLACCGSFLCLLAFHNQMRRLNKLSALSHAVISKQTKRISRAITKHVLLRNIVLQRCSFFILFKKSKSDALHIIFFTIFELRPPPPL